MFCLLSEAHAVFSPRSQDVSTQVKDYGNQRHKVIGELAEGTPPSLPSRLYFVRSAITLKRYANLWSLVRLPSSWSVIWEPHVLRIFMR